MSAIMRFAVYPGSEKLDLGPKLPACFCGSEEQARHMANFWGEFGYYERIQDQAMAGVPYQDSLC